MAWSRRRKWFVLILTILVLVAFGAMWLQPVSPLHRAFEEIQVGMTIEQVTKALDRSGWISGRRVRLTEMRLGLGEETVVYDGYGGDILSLRWKGPPCTEADTSPLLLRGRVIGKEYRSGTAVKTRDLWDSLLRMLHW